VLGFLALPLDLPAQDLRAPLAPLALVVEQRPALGAAAGLELHHELGAGAGLHGGNRTGTIPVKPRNLPPIPAGDKATSRLVAIACDLVEARCPVYSDCHRGPQRPSLQVRRLETVRLPLHGR
jgi:hypothetical protein